MKNLSPFIFVALAMIFGSTLNAQNSLDEVSKFLKNGDIQNLTNQFDEKIEVSILEDDSYTKTEAKNMLTNFFTSQTILDYVAIHKGNSGDSAHYQIGELRSGQETFRTYFFTKYINGLYYVQELRIERM